MKLLCRPSTLFKSSLSYRFRRICICLRRYCRCNRNPDSLIMQGDTAAAAASSSALAIDGTQQPAPKKNKPKGTKFRQQKLPAWQPILTASTVIPAFVGVGVLFIPLGAVLLSASDGVVEFSHDYTHCRSFEEPTKNCSNVLSSDVSKKCKCQIHLTLDQTFEGDVYFYYGLSNFYQNHRRYVKSRNDEQLLGDLDKTSSCEPFESNDSAKIVPCGAVANSMFNDTFKLTEGQPGSNGAVVKLTYDDVAWPIDKKRKFKNPSDMSQFDNYAKPDAWSKSANELDPDDPDNNGLTNVDFMVWMRTAALPTFRKLWRKLNRTDENYANGLKAGNYTLEVTYRYPVISFRGTKRFIISTTSWIGGKNGFLGVSYIVVGTLCVVLGIVFGVIHWKFGKSLADVGGVHNRQA